MMRLILKVGSEPSPLNAHDLSERQVDLLLSHEGMIYTVAKAICDPRLVKKWLTHLLENSVAQPPSHLNAHSSETPAEAISKFYESAEDELPDSIFEELLSYRRIHDIRFAFRGYDVPSVIVGAWAGGMTVSWTAPLDIPKHLNGGLVEIIY